MEESLIVLFCLVDDFCQNFMPDWEQHLLASGLKKRNRNPGLCISEIIAIYIHFHQSHYRDFTAEYGLKHICPANCNVMFSCSSKINRCISLP